MTTPVQQTQPRSYGCSMGCGNPYDVIVITVDDGTTLFVCIPCYVRLATDMIAAITDPDNADIRVALAAAAGSTGEVAPGPSGKRRGRNAPAGTVDPDLLEAYEELVTEEDLPDAFK